MNEDPDTQPSYLNPVYAGHCPDPFVLKWCGTYWCYCTGIWHDGRCFGILRSVDLLHWQDLGGALERFPSADTCYWAPEVLYRNGVFYMYYSVGDEAHMEVRVATAEHPRGPFVDSGRRLTTEEFAIDAHVFEDVDRRSFLLYATDFLEHTHIGTGTVIDELLDPLTPAGRPRPVTRARFPWQVYDPQRAEKGGVRWHTVEGPFVLRHKGLYHQMFSGGNWQNPSYGVADAITASIDDPDEWQQVGDGERVLPILRTVPGTVIGPGHNSVVRGPDNRQLFCVYHRWATDGSGRQLAIDRLDWAGDRMLVIGPTWTPQPAPIPPTIAGFGGADEENGAWSHTGAWQLQDGVLMATAATAAEARCRAAGSFLAEVSVRSLDTGTDAGQFGVGVYGAEGPMWRCLLTPGGTSAVIGTKRRDGWHTERLDLPSPFDHGAFHLLRLDLNHQLLELTIDGPALSWQGELPHAPASLALLADGCRAAFAGFELTVGWQDVFMDATRSPRELGWVPGEFAADWVVRDRQLWCSAPPDQIALVGKGPDLDAYELVVNARLERLLHATGSYGMCPTLGDTNGPEITVEQHHGGWALVCRTADGPQLWPLAAPFDPYRFQQFRFRKQHGTLTLQHEGHVLGSVAAPTVPTRVGLLARDAVVAFDLVRVTALPGNPR